MLSVQDTKFILFYIHKYFITSINLEDPRLFTFPNYSSELITYKRLQGASTSYVGPRTLLFTSLSISIFYLDLGNPKMTITGARSELRNLFTSQGVSGVPSGIKSQRDYTRRTFILCPSFPMEIAAAVQILALGWYRCLNNRANWGAQAAVPHHSWGFQPSGNTLQPPSTPQTHQPNSYSCFWSGST